MKTKKFSGGIGLLVVAALIFLLMDTKTSMPIAITLTIVGIVLVAVSKNK